MIRRPLSRVLFAATTVLALSASIPVAQAADWPQFRGPDRDGVSSETGLLDAWPETGPKECWRQPLGEGFSGVSVAGGGLFTLFADAEHELAVRLDPATGKEVWRTPIGPRFDEALGNGPRATPTVDGDRLYALSSTGGLHALKTSDGSVLWTVDLQKDLSAKLPMRGFSPSPLVDGDRVILEIGAGPGKSLAAFDRATGEMKWSVRDNPAGYASPIAVEIGGVRQLVFVHTAGDEIVSLLPDGTPHWTHPWAGGTIASPVFVPPDGIFVSASADVGGLLVKVAEGEDGPTVTEAWKDRVMKNHFGSSVYYEGHVYGFDNGTLKAVDAATGEQKWAKRGLGKGSLLIADDHIFALSDRGRLVLAKADPAGYEETGSVDLLGNKTWTAPSLADGKLYLRDMEEIVCLEVGS